MKTVRNSNHLILLKKEINDLEVEKEQIKLSPTLVERAAKIIAEFTRNLATSQTRNIVIIAGAGNNGADAILAAKHLRDWFFDINLFVIKTQSTFSTNCLSALKTWNHALSDISTLNDCLHTSDLIVDGLLGIGLNRPLSGETLKIVHAINKLKKHIIAIDIPSGLDPDSGRVMGAAIKATNTVSLLALKPGLFTNHGPDFVGKVSHYDLGVDLEEKKIKMGRLIGDRDIKKVIKPRKKNSHKGSFGKVAVFGGTTGMLGAAILAGRAALKLGAGRVQVGILTDHVSIDWGQPDLMILPAQNLIETDLSKTLCIVGPGLGQEDTSLFILTELINSKTDLILDADALNLISQCANLGKSLASRTKHCVLTPHPGEAARLLDKSITEIQDNRIKATLQISKKYNAYCLLKGVGSVFGDKKGNWLINNSGNPGMATAGMGDVLSGFIGALASQDVNLGSATIAAVRIHGLAADSLVEKNIGPIGLTASETINEARRLINRIDS